MAPPEPEGEDSDDEADSSGKCGTLRSLLRRKKKDDGIIDVRVVMRELEKDEKGFGSGG